MVKSSPIDRISRFWGRIGTKLYLALAFAMALTLVSGAVGSWYFDYSGQHTYRVRDESVPVLEASWQVYGDAQLLRRMGDARLGVIDGSDVHDAESRIRDGLLRVSAVPDLRPAADRVESGARAVAVHIEELIMARGELASSAQRVENVITRVDLAASADPALLSAMVLIRAALRTDDSAHLARLRGEMDDMMERPAMVPFGYSALFEDVFEVQGGYLGWIERVADIEASLEEDSLMMDTALNDLLGASRNESSTALTTSVESFDRGRVILLAISGASVVAALAVAWLLVGRGLLGRLSRLSQRMRGMADGDLDTPVPEVGRDEIGELAHALEVFREHALEVQRLNLIEQLAGEVQTKNDELERALDDLQIAQEQIVLREKLAALGELTAGVAHEIKNPLNFVKNFSESSRDLLDELTEVLDGNSENLNEDDRSIIQEVTAYLGDNIERVLSHGNRANSIVQDMLMMSRERREARATDINALLDEHVPLAYHSARGTDSSFQLTIEQELDPKVGEIVVNPQDVGRVFLNIVDNACDATDEKRRALEEAGDDSYVPTLRVSTERGGDVLKVRVRDNGNGMPPDVAERIFNPFFTTKTTGRGTGLGLSISNDLVRQHGGTIEVDSKVGEFTEMTVTLPLEPTEAILAPADGVQVPA